MHLYIKYIYIYIYVYIMHIYQAKVAKSKEYRSPEDRAL